MGINNLAILNTLHVAVTSHKTAERSTNTTYSSIRKPSNTNYCAGVATTDTRVVTAIMVHPGPFDATAGDENAITLN